VTDTLLTCAYPVQGAAGGEVCHAGRAAV